MDSPSWSDAFRAAFESCLYCFKSPNDSDVESLRHSDSVSRRPRPPQHLESLLAPDTDAETVSLHSNIGDSNGRRRKKKKKGPKNTKRITLFGYDLFGRRTQGVYLPEDEDEVDELLGRHGQSRSRRTSGTSSSSLTFDSDAAPLDSSQLTPAQVAERARVQQVHAEEEARAKEDRRRKRRERKELKRLAQALSSSANASAEEEFEGFQGSGNGLLDVGRGYPDIPSPFQGPDSGSGSDYLETPTSPSKHTPTSARTPDDEADDSADLDGVLYTGRKPGSGNSNSGGGSDSRLSLSDTSSSRPYPYHPTPSPTNLNTSLTPSTEPSNRTKKKSSKSSSSKSKSTKSRSSASASSSQTPSLASPTSHMFSTSASGSGSPLSEGFSLPLPQASPFKVEFDTDRGFPSTGLGGVHRGFKGSDGNAQSGAFLATREGGEVDF